MAVPLADLFRLWRRVRARRLRGQQSAILRKHRIPWQQWHGASHRIACLHGLSSNELARLRTRATAFLQQKSLVGVQGQSLDDTKRIQIAAQACLLILELDLDWFDDWQQILVYPSRFRVHRQQADEAGVVSDDNSTLSGEAWQRGPVILSWSDIEAELSGHHPGSNVIIHEFAHKLDMLNGSANGMPPLHPDMPIEAWTRSLSQAFDTLQKRIAHHHRTAINPYAATNPAEFFAVLSEYFFTAPWQLQAHTPTVYAQLKAFYRQDTLSRIGVS